MTEIFLNGVLIAKIQGNVPIFKWAKVARDVRLEVTSYPGMAYFIGEHKHEELW